MSPEIGIKGPPISFSPPPSSDRVHLHLQGRSPKHYEDSEGLFVLQDPSAYVREEIIKRQVLSREGFD